MASGNPEPKAEKSYLASAVDSINPWSGSRTSTPTTSRNESIDAVSDEAMVSEHHGSSHLYGQSIRTYPSDCPPLNVQWFHAVDVPKRKPKLLQKKDVLAEPPKPLGQAKKFIAFSVSDSTALEASYQKLLEASEDASNKRSKRKRTSTLGKQDNMSNTNMSREGSEVSGTSTRVPVNEDYLFDVDIEQRELAPVYWPGPIYEVRRGTWFYQEGSTLRPCEESLAAQLEEGYLETKPWANPVRSRSQSTVTPKASHDNLNAETAQPPPPVPQSHRLAGSYSNSAVTYQDGTVAWLGYDGVISWVTSSVYERFAGGGFMSGVKLIRGFLEPSKAKDKEETAPATALDSSSQKDERQQKLLKRRSAPPSSTNLGVEQPKPRDAPRGVETRRARLERQLSSLIESDGRNRGDTDEDIRKREEEEIQSDYQAQAGETQEREIQHLVLVTHGIGQLISMRADTVNFVHDVNVMRKTLKSVYTNSADLKALNSESGEGPGNCRVQVLPVCWRHLLEFPKQRGKKTERDLGDDDGEEDAYPSLEDITIEGVAFARSLISDLALDVLLYQSAYREDIIRIVLGECNRIVKLFRKRNPNFQGKIHIMGHSLGSAIFFDIACRQREDAPSQGKNNNKLRVWPSHNERPTSSKDKELSFEFDVEHFYCLGSPVGLFQLVKGRTIAARHSPNARPSESPLNPELAADPFLSVPLAKGREGISSVTKLPMSVSSPKCAQLYNIFHPSDPISYRLEPLVSKAMASLKPQALPYTKKSIFSNVAPSSLTGIGYAVGQGVSGLWSLLSSGLTSNVLGRSLGLSHEEVVRLASEANTPISETPPGAGTNITAGGVLTDVNKLGEKREKSNKRKKQLADSSSSTSAANNASKNATLIDDDLETLFSNFQKRRTDMSDGKSKPTEEERNEYKMRIEETKVRALNRNGRVDYSIQESVLDYNPINTIASHLGYWADEDVNHFILSQILSDKSRIRR
ncbi:DDHD domain-containing protein [Stachybotrys elegans]|uniref:DDHD domain-containing protein n=1 Tax=Stachybotrys elegans TaxID=80388 RepID=A0A8K0SVF7_9HYPO|nr:DDHD domain-containing protein [Stachybotrys elegans]